MTNSSLSFFELTERYPDEASAIAHFEELRWGPKLKDAHCPDCGSVKVAKWKTKRRLPLWTCYDCDHQFTVTSRTIMDHTMLPLRKWLFAFHIIGGSKKGVSARYLARTISVTPKTAWHLGHRIRSAMTENDQKFTGIVETDETYIGGKRKHVGKGYRKNKIAVQTIVKRSTQRTLGTAQTIALNPAGNVDGRTLGAKLRTHTVPSKTVLMTDELGAYAAPGAKFKEHHTVNHKKEEYVREDPDGHLVHTNTAEGFFGNLKRQINGTHHHVSKKHLPRYLEEFDYKYNTRDQDDGSRTVAAMKRIATAARVTLYKSKAPGIDSLFDRGRPDDSKTKRKRRKVRARKSRRPPPRKRGPRNGPANEE